MASVPVFTPRAVFWLIAIGVVSFTGAAYFAVFGSTDTVSAGANAYSYSAIGHHAFIQSLKRAGIRVILSRNNSAAKAGDTALLVVAEPDEGFTTKETVAQLLTAQNVLFVLPKWRGRPDPVNPQWLASASMLPIEDVEGILRFVDPDARVRRPASQANDVKLVSGVTALQLIESERMEPVLYTSQGQLVGELSSGGRRVWVLSDPDLLSNHGLGQGHNSELAFALVDDLRPSQGAVVFDETVHGFLAAPNLWQAIFQFPLVVVTIQVMVAVLALILASTRRFGAPVPVSSPFRPGWAGLIDNTAHLIQHRGYGPEILERYFDATLRDVSRRLHAPRNMDGDTLAEWVERVGAARGVDTRVADLQREIRTAAGSDGAGLLAKAKRIYRWKQEIVHGH